MLIPHKFAYCKMETFKSYFLILFTEFIVLNQLFIVLNKLSFAGIRCAYFFFFKRFIDLLIEWLLCWVFISVLGPSLVVASRGHSSPRCAGLTPPRPLVLQSTGSRRTGSAIVAHGPSCSTARGILPDQGSNPRPLHWQADSQPLHHQGSPKMCILLNAFLGSHTESLRPTTPNTWVRLCQLWDLGNFTRAIQNED